MVTPFIQKNNLGKRSQLLSLAWQQRSAIGIFSNTTSSIYINQSSYIGPKLYFSNDDIKLETSYLAGEASSSSFERSYESDFSFFDMKTAIYIQPNMTFNVGVNSFKESQTVELDEYLYDSQKSFVRSFQSSTMSLGLSLNEGNLFYGVGIQNLSKRVDRIVFSAVGYVNDQKDLLGEVTLFQDQFKTFFNLTGSIKLGSFQLKNTSSFIEGDVTHSLEINGEWNDSFYYGLENLFNERGGKFFVGFNYKKYNFETSLDENSYTFNLNYQI